MLEQQHVCVNVYGCFFFNFWWGVCTYLCAVLSGLGVEVDRFHATDATGKEALGDYTFIAFARIFSGEIRCGQQLFVLGPKHNPATALIQVRKLTGKVRWWCYSLWHHGCSLIKSDSTQAGYFQKNSNINKAVQRIIIWFLFNHILPYAHSWLSPFWSCYLSPRINTFAMNTTPNVKHFATGEWRHLVHNSGSNLGIFNSLIFFFFKLGCFAGHALHALAVVFALKTFHFWLLCLLLSVQPFTSVCVCAVGGYMAVKK